MHQRMSDAFLRTAREHADHPEGVDRDALVEDVRGLLVHAMAVQEFTGWVRDMGLRNVGRGRIDERDRVLRVLAALPATTEHDNLPTDSVAYISRDAAVNYIVSAACARCDGGELHEADPIEPASGRYWHSAGPQGGLIPCARPGDSTDALIAEAWERDQERRREMDASVARAAARKIAHG